MLGTHNCCRIRSETIGDVEGTPAEQMYLLYAAEKLQTEPADESFGKRYASNRLEEEIVKGEGILVIPDALLSFDCKEVSSSPMTLVHLTF